MQQHGWSWWRFVPLHHWLAYKSLHNWKTTLRKASKTRESSRKTKTSKPVPTTAKNSSEEKVKPRRGKPHSEALQNLSKKSCKAGEAGEKSSPYTGSTESADWCLQKTYVRSQPSLEECTWARCLFDAWKSTNPIEEHSSFLNQPPCWRQETGSTIEYYMVWFMTVKTQLLIWIPVTYLRSTWQAGSATK